MNIPPIRIVVMDEDLTYDDEVGNTELRPIDLMSAKPIDMWYDIYYKGKTAGKIRLKTTFFEPAKQGDLQNLAS